MAVTNPETFILSGGACAVTAEQPTIVAALADQNITGVASGATIVITNSTLASTTRSTERFETLINIANAANAKLAYAVAT